MRLRPLGIDHLGLEQFKDGGGESGLLLQRERCAGRSPRATRAVSIRTARTGSLSSGATASSMAGDGADGSARGAAARNERVWVGESRLDRGLGCGESPRAQAAPRRSLWRLLAGRDRRSANRAKARHRRRLMRPAYSATPKWGRVCRPCGNHSAMRCAPQSAVWSAWHCVQALGVPIDAERSGRGNANAVIAPVVHPHVGF